ncbi:MAG: hypothetical protein JSS28_08885 [Proteobacteria bacterium]|nr:hypothetical protein [Pseudomonadota bacterium]
MLMSTVSPLPAAAIALRKLPLPASLQFVTAIVAAPANGLAMLPKTRSKAVASGVWCTR